MDQIQKRQAWEQFKQQLDGPIAELHQAVVEAKKVVAELESTAMELRGMNTALKIFKWSWGIFFVMVIVGINVR